MSGAAHVLPWMRALTFSVKLSQASIWSSTLTFGYCLLNSAMILSQSAFEESAYDGARILMVVAGSWPPADAPPPGAALVAAGVPAQAVSVRASAAPRARPPS